MQIAGVILPPVTIAAAVGATVGITHYTAHRIAGDEAAFDDAGVKVAGTAASVMAALGTYLALTGV